MVLQFECNKSILVAKRRPHLCKGLRPSLEREGPPWIKLAQPSSIKPIVLWESTHRVILLISVHAHKWEKNSSVLWNFYLLLRMIKWFEPTQLQQQAPSTSATNFSHTNLKFFKCTQFMAICMLGFNYLDPKPYRTEPVDSNFALPFF